jgi:Na+/proline symporter
MKPRLKKEKKKKAKKICFGFCCCCCCFLAVLGFELRAFVLTRQTIFLKLKGWSVAQVVELLSSKYKGLSSNHSTAKI